MVLRPCTDHMTLTRAPKERLLRALSVRFLYDRRDVSGFGSARAQGPPGTENDCGTRVSAAHREPRPWSHAHVLSVQHERQPLT